MSRTTFSGPVASINGFTPNGRLSIGNTAAGNANATAAAYTTAQFAAAGYFTCTSAGVTTITLPIAVTAGTVQGLVQALNAHAGQTFDFVVDNTGGASNVTVAIAAPALCVLSDGATIAASAVAFGRLVVAAGATGMAKFTIMFTGGNAVPAAIGIANQPAQGTPGTATGYTLTRTA